VAGPVFMLASEAIREVLSRVDMLDDDVGNPALESMILMHLNAAQRQLQVEHAWLVQQRSARVTVTGPAFVVPAGVRYGRVQSVTWTDGAGGNPVRLVPGIDSDALDYPGIPERFELVVGDDGEVSVQLWPTVTGGSVVIAYQAGVTPIAEATDRLSLDDEAVIGRAGWLLANARNMPCAGGLLAAHNSYLNRASAQQSPGAVMSLRRVF
jgi:hypothetical protein